MSREAIILAGGLGTRLRSVVADLPKCMAPVAGKPFLSYVINHLQQQGVDKFIFSLGYKHAYIEEWLNQSFPLLFSQIAIEEEPLGTGGAIKLACTMATEENVLVLNGDTLFSLDARKLMDDHTASNAACTLSLKPMKNFDRYGVVELDESHHVSSFKEKQYYAEGLINAGVYALNCRQFLAEALPEKFSFEKDYLEKLFRERNIRGLVQDCYFIDIGIPEDYAKAQNELAGFNPGNKTRQPAFSLSQIDHSWTIFLDRDGVINHEKHEDYIHNWDEFRFYDGVPEAFAIFARRFHRIIIVTNQRGIGKGVTKLTDLEDIHERMQAAVETAGGRIDAVYYCPDLDNESPNRKPNPGMGLQAMKDFPDIDISKALMVGNTMSDMKFGRNLGIHTVFLPTTRPEVNQQDPAIDLVFDSLLDFANALPAEIKQ